LLYFVQFVYGWLSPLTRKLSVSLCVFSCAAALTSKKNSNSQTNKRNLLYLGTH
jgi:hypothetical protein